MQGCACTTQIERHHKFAKHLAFGEHGLLRSNDPSDQEKAIVYNELVANAVVLQNVVDQTLALHVLKSEGTRFSNADLAYLSPYGTSNLKRFGQFPDGPNTGPGADGERSIVMIDGTMTVSDDGGKPIVEET